MVQTLSVTVFDLNMPLCGPSGHKRSFWVDMTEGHKFFLNVGI